MASEDWSDQDEYEVPLQDRRPFGAGLKRKRVVFVPASTGGLNTTEETRIPKPSRSVSDMYLSIVLPKDANQSTGANETNTPAPQICQVCSLPINKDSEAVDTNNATGRPHEASIAHQVCMTHSHPPSALDRSRMGLGVLQSQGWDPDSRIGLGATQQGMKYPIKAKPKYDTLGIGVEVPKDAVVKKKKEKVQTLDAKKARKKAADDKRRHKKLRQQFYGNSDVDKYLGHG
ncbi:Uu.00g018000.m01.CDS01 [Anthostomella pinea]|uniref:Uu.00g018000.m01.CDS01 n=1 Tax=Anthostomella pinea TaxID=933095 RepID=A0AAI8VZ24_9PEZI|nr:Uu.00g018000.m01.CDS01 [Anthostomella pinea]